MWYENYYIRQLWNNLLDCWDVYIYKNGDFFMHCTHDVFIGEDQIPQFIENVEELTDWEVVD